MIFFRRIYRLSLLLVHVLKGVILTLWHSNELKDGIPSKRFQVIKQQWLQSTCDILKIEIHCHGTAIETPTMLISNHISWIDIPLIGSQISLNFLSKYEVKSWPIVGWLAAKCGTLFIKRGSEGAAHQARADIQHYLEAGEHILIFPEGTTTNGSLVKRFHPRLFAVATEQETWVQPIAIRYCDIQGNISQIVPFIDNEPLITNLWGILGENKIIAELHFLPPIHGSDYPMRRAISEKAREQISNVLGVSEVEI